ncbi:hypothetical protein HBI56_123340 [Parastagonospora nodorum]|uniref:Uncharacterized protein n=1 Tax=Phaeosphaeria nodorum (strain SN15 / ATCC MYA-4574 / FGSC 10173) TaxID=321614 RepID=A0A7U2F6A5_PHANO|nr:hypothetical protein HBH56_093050 [Parastagonospora nodorum]QRC98418.1 hypothetical protein JI435_435680 [Parastagonospora nodorum SN15]KAH3936149.1 hypothetical protein HBH54_027700 [Parastagonospora nodorum]KAH3948224.1 hypothetical protein HBH53_102520 [Parastagonospora nodorum]KAH3956481.1 hypothetical protein HBH51_241050 [Parastagonospora nodorum]
MRDWRARRKGHPGRPHTNRACERARAEAMELESGDGQCETRFAGCEWMLVQSVVMAAEESGLSRPYSGLHQSSSCSLGLHNNTDSACGQRAERGQALLFLTLSSRVFTLRGRTCESETRDGGISLEIYGSGRPSAKPVTLYALRAALYVSIGGALAAARELEPRRAGVVPERRQVGLRVDTTMGGR